MKTIIALAVVAAFAIVATSAAAATATAARQGTASPQAGQQNRMVSCNKEAVGKTGAERKAFMKTCLSTGKAGAAAKKTRATDGVDGRAERTSRMKQCNVEARGKSGDERKAYMKTCLAA